MDKISMALSDRLIVILESDIATLVPRVVKKVFMNFFCDGRLALMNIPPC
jgi:hypothetical protein